MRNYILAETNWKYLKDQKIELAILPWGATEAHNFHLPYSTDVIESDYIASESAKIAYNKGAKVIVLPTVPFGVNTGQSDILLDLNIYPSTQRAILNDLIEVLDRQSIHKLIIINSHGGNDFKPILRELGAKYPKMFLSLCNWYSAFDKSKYFENDGDHADEMETSIMLNIAPNLVLPLNEAGEGIERNIKIDGIKNGLAWTERKWSKVTYDTGIGNPYKATAEKGEIFLKDLTEKLAELYIDICKSDQENLYE